ncbi:alpha-amylase family glycosyl hydrolase [Coraliomargarita sp. SDUM461004]|uniref:Alpha-amylase family glycosyl hydrolase n=1 Tax=Thalassobacterium sedimentorum TaxID=3041258 RepID=A0ABU1AJI3_9BACT|nr:alpha-amylase family glycosyl hydrolase [Coraliomargarita sp. SDUM461004]MDQ8194981.1 alpha-amylase family glycosyl hydrolase [Coraliomargarita sp. SDUM461004]
MSTELENPHYPRWLKDAIFYEVYPQSFRDSNGDGIGDLPGVIEKLDYIRSLGCDTVWLNPFYASPFRDAGYDVTDHYAVAERYGCMEDVIRLFEEAHRRGMRVVLDLVPGHTAELHPWFQASAKHERNEYSDYYIWTDSVLTLGETDLRMIAGDVEREGAHAINFFSHQPALNYGYAHPDPNCSWQQATHAPGPTAVRAELNRLMRFWLEQGCDGFRVDMAHSLIKGGGNQAAMHELWAEVRAWMDIDFPDAVLLAEWGKPAEAIQAGFHMDFMIHFGTSAYTSLFRKQWGFSFSLNPYGCSFFDRSGRGNIREFVDVFEREYAGSRGKGFVSLPTGNHDVAPRLADGRDAEDLKVAYAFLLTMPGIPTIYYGDEIGMKGVQGLPSKEGGYIRTMVRTPMQWDASEQAGFSEAAQSAFYLPLEERADRPDVATQMSQPDSLLHCVRQLIALRRAMPALGNEADYRTLFAEPGQVPYVYLRSNQEQRVIVAINPTAQIASVSLSTSIVNLERAELVMGVGELKFEADASVLTLPSVSFGIWCLT